MPAHIIESDDVIDMDFVPFLIYGPPGCGKTSLAQTAEKPLTIDFDNGIHRSFNRKIALRFDSWDEHMESGGRDGKYLYPSGHHLAGRPIDYQTIILDTGGRALDAMIPDIMQASVKNCGIGGLSQQGWRVLGTSFQNWIREVRKWGKQIVMLCHERDTADFAGNPKVVPDFPGKMAFDEIHKNFDMIGRIRYDGRQRFLDFNPYEGATCCKNAAGLLECNIDNLEEQPNLLGSLINMAKRNIGKTIASSERLAKAVENWSGKIAICSEPAKLNAILPQLSDLPIGIRRQVWSMILQHAESNDWEFDRKTKCFNLAKETA